MRIPTHYERLGINSEASQDEIRAAYRALARRHHPDAVGGSTSAEMAAINEAWHVLSDVGRRAVYDGGLRRAATAQERERRLADVVEARDHIDPGRARFPWKPLAWLAGGIAVAIIASGALISPSEPPPPDVIIEAGSCVEIQSNRDVIEASCSGPNDGVATIVISFESVCPIGTEGFRDRQGLGTVCVRPNP